ncbi:MAG: MGMT family protein, partial [Chloroflexota bacterium]
MFLGLLSAKGFFDSLVGHNPVAYLIPCHRVLRKSGEFGNSLYG